MPDGRPDRKTIVAFVRPELASEIETDALEYGVAPHQIAELALEEYANKIRNNDAATLNSLREAASRRKPKSGSNLQKDEP